MVVAVHSLGRRTCVVTASHGRTCCPKCFNWWSGVATVYSNKFLLCWRVLINLFLLR